MTRLEANLQILEVISTFAQQNPDLRFSQILYALDVIEGKRDDFYTESETTLAMVKEALAELNK
jgi:hypothetical protein